MRAFGVFVIGRVQLWVLLYDLASTNGWVVDSVAVLVPHLA